MYIAIIENDIKDAELLNNMILHYCTKHSIEHSTRLFESGEQFIKSYTGKEYDVIFLDIFMDGMTGMEVATKIRSLSESCLIVFSTQSRDFAVESYSVRAFHYLVKPYGYPELYRVMELCDKALMKRSHYIEVKEGRSLTKIRIGDILFTDYSNHYIYIHMNKKTVRCYKSFDEFSPILLKYPQFLNCYRNCLVNMDKVSTIDGRDFVMENGEKIPIYKKKFVELKEQYADYVFNMLEESM